MQEQLATDLVPPGTRVVGWYRRDLTRRLLRIFIPGTIPIMVGGLLVAGALRQHAGPLSARPTMVFEEQSLAPSAILPGPAVLPVRSDMSGLQLGMLLVGILMVASGPAWSIRGFRRLIQGDDEEFLLLRTDGVLAILAGKRWELAWDDVDEVVHLTTDDSVELRLRDGQVHRIVEPLVGIDPRGLARRLEDVRRKAIWNLLPQQR